MAKPAEKPFSPPRSNNIMDYFSRRPPSSKEKTSPSEQSKENCQTSQSTEKHTGSEGAVKQPSQKRGRKAIKAARRLVEAENVGSTGEVDCVIIDKPEQCKDSAAEVTSSCGLLGSDPAALLAQLSAEASDTSGTLERSVSVKQTEKDEHHDNGSQCGNKLKPELKSIPSSPPVPLRDKAKQVKTGARNSKKKHQQEAKQPEPEEKEAETSLCEVNMEVNEDQALQSRNSTVTVSFEDFVRSQSQDKDGEGRDKESEITTYAEEMNNDQLKHVGCGEPLLQISPRTVTIQAQVHAVSPKQEAIKAVGKLASIFSKRKGPVSPAEAVSSPPTEAEHQLPSTLLSVKRKSNVVLQEEDLELAVLESESMPKCTVVERKQFMAAFKQPSLDGSKAKPVKSQGKQKQPEERNSDAAADQVAEEDSVIPLTVEQVPADSQENSAPKKKPARKGRKKAKDENEAVTASLTVAAAPLPPVEEAVVMISDDKEEEPTIPPVRRSRREALAKQETKSTTTSPVRKKRKQNKSKEAAGSAGSAASPDCPVQMSTPKTRKSKHGVFVAEMVCEPDTEESPIR